jgi:chromosome segregation ATPase
MGQHTTIADRVAHLEQKYLDLFNDNKRLERELAMSKRKCDLVTKERDGGKSELNKMTSQKQKLEALCRELQKENKKLKESPRQESSPVSTSPEDLHALVQEEVRALLTHYQTREKQHQAVLKAKDMEVHMLRAQLDELRGEEGPLKATSDAIRRQMSMYLEKFTGMESHLEHSNRIFKTEMERTAQSVKKLTDELRASEQREQQLRETLQHYEQKENGVADID